MNGYLLPLRCPACGEPLEHVNASHVGEVATTASAIAACARCRREFGVFVHLRPVQAHGDDRVNERRRERYAMQKVSA